MDGVSHCILHNTSCGLLAIAVTYCEHEQIQDSENISFSIAEDDKDSNASEVLGSRPYSVTKFVVLVNGTT